MTSLFFRKDQNDLFKKQLEENVEELKVWNIINVWVPSCIILIPSFFYSFLPEDRTNLQNLILNGSFSLLGISILFSMSIFLINSTRLKDVKIEKQIYDLRIRLIIYLCILLVLGTIIYCLQIAFNITSANRIWTILVGFIVILYLSVGIGRRIYLIKDELVGKSFNDDIKETVNGLKNSTDDLD